jgi:hypothetical protein
MGRSISARCSNCFTTLITDFEQWARGKYKTLSQHKRRGGQWLRKMKMVTPRMFFPLACGRDNGWIMGAV